MSELLGLEIEKEGRGIAMIIIRRSRNQTRKGSAGVSDRASRDQPLEVFPVPTMNSL
jgi:hypothetical protein